jgi:hypothetical protein
MTAIIKFLGWRGLAGIGVALVLTAFLVAAKIDARHWQKQSGQFEELYRAEVTAHQQTIGNYRVAAEQARQADAANASRVVTEQKTNDQERSNALETRLADARATADRLRGQFAQATAHPGSGSAAPVPGVQPSPAGSAQGASKDGFSVDDRLTATEQAIQLDELIKWVRKQAGIDVNGKPPAPAKGSN